MKIPNISPRLIAIDVDGTLLNASHELTEATKESVKATRKAGIDVVLVSARGAGLMRKIVYELDLYEPCQFVAAQGALVASFDTSGNLRTAFENRLPLPIAHKIVKTALKLGVSVSWFRGVNWLANSIDDPIRQEAAIVHELPLISCLADETTEPHKLLLIDPTHSLKVDQLVPLQHDESNLQNIQIELSKPGYIEITQYGVNKGAAIKIICQRKGISADNVVAIGNGLNDLTMFAFAGTSIAMENSPAIVRKRADLVTLSNSEDGVAHALSSIVRAEQPR